MLASRAVPFQLKNGGAWDYPLCKDEKSWRLTQLFKAELEHEQDEIRTLQGQNMALRRKVSLECHMQRLDDIHFNQDDQLVALKRLCTEQAQRLHAMEEATCELQKDRSLMQRLHDIEIHRAHSELSRQTTELNECLAAHRRREAELQTSLAVLREFGQELRHDLCQSQSVPSHAAKQEVPAGDAVPALSVNCDCTLDASMPSVLIAVDVDFGMTTATICVAPWHTSADYDAIVRTFLEEHRVRTMFAPVLVQYLEDVEKQATSFPVTAKANLSDLYSRYG